MKTSKRIGCIALCIAPLPIVIVLQNLASIPACGITAIITFLNNYQSGLPPAEILNEAINLWTSSAFTLWVSALYAVFALAVFGFWFYKKLRASEERVGLKYAFNPYIIASMALLAFGLQYVVTYLMDFIAVLRPDWMKQYTDLLEMAGINEISPILILYSCIIAPVSEELIFRGVSLGYAKKAMPLIGAVVLQAVLFGIFHMNIIQGIYAAVLGLFMGYVREAGGTIAISMLLHACFNLVGTCLNRFLFYNIEHLFFFLLYLTLGVLLTFAGVFLFQHGLTVRQWDMELLTESQPASAAHERERQESQFLEKPTDI